MLGYDPHLDTAIQVVLDEFNEVEEEEFDEYGDEDEDY